VLDERDLVSRMRRGDQRAFDEFFGAYAPRLNSFVVRRSSLDAGAIEDVVQMTMINAMRNLGSYRGAAALFTWLCKICRNQLADARRNSARQPTTLGDELSGREIARTLQVSEDAAESLLARARQAFRAAWTANLDDGEGAS